MIIWLYGADTFRSRLKLQELKEKFKKDVDAGESSIVEFSGEDFDMARFAAAAAPSLFARKRLIIVERLIAARKKEASRQLAEHLAARPDEAGGNIIVFWEEIDPGGKKAGYKSDPLFKYLEKQKFKQEFKPMTAAQVQDWVRSRAAELGVQIKAEAARLLAALAGSDLWAINSEISKLAHYKSGQSLLPGGQAAVIETADVEQMVKGAVNANIFALTDALSRKDKAMALDCLEKELAAGAADAYLLHMVVRQFRIMLRVKQALDLGQSSRQIQSDLKLHPFALQKTIGQVRQHRLQDLKEIFLKLARIDQRLKTGRSDLKTDISLLITVL